jgi:ribosomal protein L11 methyltransferase
VTATALRAVSLDLDGLDAAAVEEACFAAGAYSVVLTDRRDDAILEPRPGEIRLWPATRLQAIFPEDCVDEAALRRLAGTIGCPAGSLSVEAVPERAWEREWLKDFVPMRFGGRLWICPSHASVGAADAVVVTLDPGLAFGTGTHPTTRLCLEYLDARGAAGGLVVDSGCGSGVLAIAALRLDAAARALAHDIDPQALTATRDNALVNGVGERLATFLDPTDLLAAIAARGPAQLVLANILAGPLCELAPRLSAILAADGELVLAGLLEEQAEEVIAAYAPTVPLRRWRTLDGWTCLAGRRQQAVRP